MGLRTANNNRDNHLAAHDRHLAALSELADILSKRIDAQEAVIRELHRALTRVTDAVGQ